MNLNIGTLNLNGLKQLKRQEMFLDYLKRSSWDVLALQELDTPKIKNLQKLRYMLFTAGATHDTGFIIKEELEVNPEDFAYEEDGKICSMKLSGMTLVNVHMPSGTNNAKERVFVTETILPKYTPPNGKIVLLGNFNCVLREDDISVKNKKVACRRINERLKNLFRLTVY